MQALVRPGLILSGSLCTAFMRVQEAPAVLLPGVTEQIHSAFLGDHTDSCSMQRRLPGRWGRTQRRGGGLYNRLGDRNHGGLDRKGTEVDWMGAKRHLPIKFLQGSWAEF